MLSAAAATDRIALCRVGESQPLVVHNAPAEKRPYLHPLRSPKGQGILTEDAPGHHPWQHGLYTGLNDVNGIGFWKEGGANGTFHPEPLRPPLIDSDTARWVVRSEWRAPESGAAVLHETQAWTLTDRGETYCLDLDWSLRAAGEPVTFGQHTYGGLFLRMPYRGADSGATVRNNAGQEFAAAEQQRARWVAAAMPIEGLDGGMAGIAVFDHLSNSEYPTPWRVDKQMGIAPSRCIAGAWTLDANQFAQFRHRLFVFMGAINSAAIDAAWDVFAAVAEGNAKP